MKWKGYAEIESTWEPPSNFSDSHMLVIYHEKHKAIASSDDELDHHVDRKRLKPRSDIDVVISHLIIK